jgi:hypothetical protein
MILVVHVDEHTEGLKEKLTFMSIPFDDEPSLAVPVKAKLPHGSILSQALNFRQAIISAKRDADTRSGRYCNGLIMSGVRPSAMLFQASSDGLLGIECRNKC